MTGGVTMWGVVVNKRAKRNLAAFQRIVARRPQYHVSPYGVHDQAIREHKKRGFGAGLQRVTGILNQDNRI